MRHIIILSVGVWAAAQAHLTHTYHVDACTYICWLAAVTLYHIMQTIYRLLLECFHYVIGC